MSKFCCSNKHQVSEFGDTNEWKVHSAMNKLLTENGKTKDEMKYIQFQSVCMNIVVAFLPKNILERKGSTLEAHMTWFSTNMGVSTYQA